MIYGIRDTLLVMRDWLWCINLTYHARISDTFVLCFLSSEIAIGVRIGRFYLKHRTTSAPDECPVTLNTEDRNLYKLGFVTQWKMRFIKLP